MRVIIMRDFEDFMNFTKQQLNLDEQVAHQFARSFQQEFGGDRYYINKNSSRDREIKSSYNGKNAAELAKRYGLSERRIFDIVA